MDAVAFFGAAGEDLAEEDDLLVPLLHGAAALRERGDLVVVRGEEAAGTDVCTICQATFSNEKARKLV